MINILTTEGYLIHLLISVADGRKPDEKPNCIQWDELYGMAVYHSVANMAFYAVEQLENKPDETLYRQWSEVRDKAVVRDIVQRSELDSLCAAFSAEGIRCLPLKGCRMKKLYPRTDQRMMSDLDLLIDEENAEKVRDIMLRQGYTCAYFGMETHDVYQKQPIMDVEIHRNLVRKRHTAMSSYYSKLLDSCTPSAEDPYVLEMSAEDIYAYHIAHLYKHYTTGGCGIRSVLDTYLLNRAEGGLWDRKKLQNILRSLELEDFEAQMRGLAYAWWGERELTAEEAQMTEYIVKSGTYGTTEHDVEKEIADRGRVRYFFYRMFLDYDTLKYMYPVLKKHPVLLPFCQLRRIVSALAKKPKKCLYIFSLFFKKKDK